MRKKTKNEEKSDIMEDIKKMCKGIDPALDEAIDRAIEEKKKFDAMDAEKELLTVTVKKDKHKVKFNVDTIDQMCIVANMAIHGILNEIPKSKRKAVIRAMLVGTELMD